MAVTYKLLITLSWCYLGLLNTTLLLSVKINVFLSVNDECSLLV